MNCNALTAFFLAGAGVLGSTAPAPAASADSDPIIISRPRDSMGFLKPIPVSISGFTGESLATLKNDLLFMGIHDVKVDDAMYLVSGSAAARVEGFLTEKSTKRQILGKAYTGGSIRTQIHALADDIAAALTRLPGIAQTKITFKVGNGPGRSEIYVSDYDGHTPTSVTRDGSIVSAPCWAGKGALVYSSYKLGNPYIFSHVLGTGQRTAIARHAGDNYSPAVSRDAKRLAMILNKSGSPNLYVANIDGSGLKQLTSSREGEACPAWSPDGETICFVSRSGGTPGLYKISASGGKPVRIPTPGAPTPTEPDWSPDGKWIAFTSLTGGFNIFIVSVQEGRVFGPLAAGEDPSWAPNSRAIIFCNGPDQRKILSLLDVPTKQVKTLARILESNSQPSWAK